MIVHSVIKLRRPLRIALEQNETLQRKQNAFVTLFRLKRFQCSRLVFYYLYYITVYITVKLISVFVLWHTYHIQDNKDLAWVDKNIFYTLNLSAALGNTVKDQETRTFHFMDSFYIDFGEHLVLCNIRSITSVLSLNLIFTMIIRKLTHCRSTKQGIRCSVT